MLTPREAFKVGFISHCIDQGIDLSKAAGDIDDLVEKVAGLTDLPGKALDLAKPVISNALGYGIPIGIAAPPILGGLAGYGIAKATDADDTDVDEIKKREKVQAYQDAIQKLQREQQARTYKTDRQSAGRVFL